MTDTAELIERLNAAQGRTSNTAQADGLLWDAADALETLQAENERLRSAVNGLLFVHDNMVTMQAMERVLAWGGATAFARAALGAALPDAP